MSAISARSLGEQGETLAAAFLVEQGYSILARNWRSRLGELDIVAEDPDGTRVFVEVKSRRAIDIDPLTGISARKRRILISTAQVYLAQHGCGESPWRFDVIAVTFAAHQPPAVVHFHDAFDW